MAPLLSIKPVKGDRWSAHKKHCTATLVKLKKLATGQQKPRHASLLPAGAGTLPRFGFTAPAFTPARTTEVVQSGGRSATLTPFIAGPLPQIFVARSIIRPSGTASNKIYREMIPFELLPICTATHRYFRTYVSIDTSCYLDNFSSPALWIKTNTIKNWLPALFCYLIHNCQDGCLFYNALYPNTLLARFNFILMSKFITDDNLYARQFFIPYPPCLQMMIVIFKQDNYLPFASKYLW